MTRHPASFSRAESYLDQHVTVREAIAYLHRVGLHAAADRMSSDRAVVVIRPDDPSDT